MVLSASHRTFVRAALATGELVSQDLDTGATNRTWSLGIQINNLVLSPNGRRVYVESYDPGLGDTQAPLLELDLDAPEQLVELPWRVPQFAHGLVVTDDRVAVVTLAGNTDPPYRLRVVDLDSGTVGVSFVSVAGRDLVLSRDQRSVFAYLPSLPTQSRVYRVAFDAASRSFGSRRALPERVPGEYLLPPFGFTADETLVLNQFGAFRNAPGASDDLKRIAVWQLSPTFGLFENSQVPDASVLLGTQGLGILRRDSLDGGGFWPYPEGQGERAVGIGDEVFAVVRNDDATTIRMIRTAIPWNQIATNQPPQIVLVTNPVELNTAEDVVLDASGTTDDVSPLGRLVFRWDLDGDGKFERGFSSNPKFVHHFSVAGEHTINLEVQDELGSRARLQSTFQVVARRAPSYPVETLVPWELDFAVGTALFDAPNGRLFCMDETHRRLTEISLTTGRATRAWPVDYRLDVFGTPGGTIVNLSLSPDGHTLVAAERRPAFDETSTFPVHYVVEYELGNGVSDLGGRGLQVENPNFLKNTLVTADGFLAIGAAGYFSLRRWPDLNPVTEVRLGSDFPEVTVLSAPTNGVVYCSVHPSVGGSLRLVRFKYDSTSGAILENRSTTVVGDRLVIAANGQYLITDRNSVRRADPEMTPDFNVVGTMSARFGVLGLDLVGRGLVGLRGDGYWDFVRTSDWSSLASQSATYFSRQGVALAAGADDHQIYELLAAENGLPPRVVRRPLPAATLAQNEPPTVTWTHPPGPNYQLGSILKFTATADDSDGAVTNLVLLNHGVPVPPIPDLPGFPAAVAGEWILLPTSGGAQSFQVVATDNLGAVRRTETLALRYNQPPQAAWVVGPGPRLKSPATLALEISANDADPEDAITRVRFLRDNSGTLTLLSELTTPPWRLELLDFVGFFTGFRVDVLDRFGGITTLITNVPVDPLPGRIYSQPLLISGEQFTARASSRSSPAEPSFVALGPFNTGFTGVWWEWKAPRDLDVDIDTFGSSFDTYLEVTRPDIGRSTTLQNNETPLARPWSRMKFSVRSNEVYRIGVGAGSQDQSGDIVLNLHSTPRPTELVAALRPTNDIPTSGVLLETGVRLDGTTRGAVLRPSIAVAPRLGLIRWAGPSVWYRWTSAANTWVRVAVSSTQMDPVVRVGLPWAVGGQPAALAESDDAAVGSVAAEVVFPAVAGTTYWVQIVGATETAGDFQVLLEANVAPPVIPPTPNRRWQEALELSLPLQVVSATTIGLVPSADAPGTLKNYPTSWYRWTAAHSGTVWWWLDESNFRLALPGSGFERRVFQPDGVGGLSAVLVNQQRRNGSSPDLLRLSFSAQEGVTYYLAASNLTSPGTTNFTFSLNAAPQEMSTVLSLPTEIPNGGKLQVKSPYPRYVQLQESLDLRQWHPAGSQFLNLGVGDYFLPALRSPGAFYRAVGID